MMVHVLRNKKITRDSIGSVLKDVRLIIIPYLKTLNNYAHVPTYIDVFKIRVIFFQSCLPPFSSLVPFLYSPFIFFLPIAFYLFYNVCVRVVIFRSTVCFRLQRQTLSVISLTRFVFLSRSGII